MLSRKGVDFLLVMLTVLAGSAHAEIKRIQTAENKVILQGPAWRMTWDGERGGELSEVKLYDGRKWYRVNSSFAFKSLDTLPALSFASTRDSYYSGKWDVYYANEGRACRFETLKETPTDVHFRVSTRPRVMESGEIGPWTVTYTWHVYEVGVVFCDFEIDLPKGKTFDLAWSLMGMHVEDYTFKEKHQGREARFLWNWGALGKTSGRRRWQPVVLSSEAALPLDIDLPPRKDASIVTGRWVPYGSAAFNLDHLPDTSYTNGMEVVFETAKPLWGEDVRDFGSHFKFRQSGLSRPPTSWGSDRNPPTFSFEWNLYNGKTTEVTGPVKYRNRFGMGFTFMRTTGNPKAPTPLKNRLQGARIYHWVNTGQSGARWYPGDAQIAGMASVGADVLILADGWRKAADDYTPAVPGEFRRVIGAAHRHGIRVGVTMRADDLYLLEKDTSWFTGYLERGRDGIYVSRNGFLFAPANLKVFPVEIKGEGVTAVGSSEAHIDAFAHFLWTKKLRALVGDNGFLIGRAAPQVPTRIAMAYFDCCAPDGARLAGTPHDAVHRRFASGNGCAPLLGRGRTPAQRASSAAYGDAAQVMLGANEGDPIDPGHRDNAALAPLWRIWKSADIPSATAYNTRSTAAKVFRISVPTVPGTLYRISDDEMMLVLGNLGPSAEATVTLDFKQLRMPSGTFSGKAMRISPAGVYSEDAAPIIVRNGEFSTGQMDQYAVAAFHLRRESSPGGAGQ